MLEREWTSREREIDLWQRISGVLMETSGMALLGDTFECDDAACRGFYYWESRIVEMIKIPKWLMRKETQARKKLIGR